jgi:hypothetical protein
MLAAHLADTWQRVRIREFRFANSQQRDFN